ncbi:MAG: P63C domain-containing protein [Candidatus Binataceae bacterium]
MGENENQQNPKVRAALARAQNLTSEQRKDISRKAALARWDGGNLPVATHESKEPLRIGDMELYCAVLQNKTRVITQASFLRVLGRSRSPKAGTGVFATVDELPFFLQADALKPFISDELLMSTNPIFYRTLSGGRGVGYNALLLRQVAEVYLKFRDDQLATKGRTPARYENIIRAADTLIRGLADVGIVALVDQATGYERDRAKGDLEKILDRFIAKELRPWVSTFPDEFYEHLFRLRGLMFPRDSVKRPQYFGHLTNDIIWRRLAPGVLERLREVIPRRSDGRPAVQFHRKLTENFGYRKLLEHLGSAVTLMKLSKDSDYEGFLQLLDRIHPRYGETRSLPFGGPEPKTGL